MAEYHPGSVSSYGGGIDQLRADVTLIGLILNGTDLNTGESASKVDQPVLFSGQDSGKPVHYRKK